MTSYTEPAASMVMQTPCPRRPCTQCGRAKECKGKPGAITAAIETAALSPLPQRSSKEIRQLQEEDPSIGVVLRAKESNQKPTSDQARGGGPETQRLVQLWDRLLIEDGLLMRKFEDAHGQTTWMQLLLPKPLRNEVMHAGALEGHLGEEKTLHKIKERFYWPGMHHDVKSWCQTCSTCATRKTAPKTNLSPL